MGFSRRRRRRWTGWRRRRRPPLAAQRNCLAAAAASITCRRPSEGVRSQVCDFTIGFNVRLSVSSFSGTMLDGLELAGADKREFSGVSARRGGITTATKAGVPMAVLWLQSGHAGDRSSRRHVNGATWLPSDCKVLGSSPAHPRRTCVPSILAVPTRIKASKLLELSVLMWATVTKIQSTCPVEVNKTWY